MHTPNASSRRFYWKPAILGAVILPMFLFVIQLKRQSDRRDGEYEAELTVQLDSYESELRKSRSPAISPEEEFDEAIRRIREREKASRSFASQGERDRDQLERIAKLQRLLAEQRQERISALKVARGLPEKPGLFMFILREIQKYPAEFAAFFSVAAVVGFLLPLAVGWMATYPHSGWKRVCVLIAPIACCAMLPVLANLYKEAPPASFVVGAIFLVGSPLLILISRELVLWIIRGFRQTANQKATPSE